MPDSANFDFLNEHDPIFLQLASAAEGAFVSDPNTTLIKLRQLGEALAVSFFTPYVLKATRQPTSSKLNTISISETLFSHYSFMVPAFFF